MKASSNTQAWYPEAVRRWALLVAFVGLTAALVFSTSGCRAGTVQRDTRESAVQPESSSAESEGAAQVESSSGESESQAGKLIAVNEADFQSQVLEAKEPVLTDFWAPWCGPCRMVEPTLESIAKRYAGKVKVVRVNVDENQAIAQEYRITAIPTLIIFREGKVVYHALGVQPEDTIADAVDKALGN